MTVKNKRCILYSDCYSCSKCIHYGDCVDTDDNYDDYIDNFTWTYIPVSESNDEKGEHKNDKQRMVEVFN